jgi:hypothetical protein
MTTPTGVLMREAPNLSRWNERRAATILNHHLYAACGLEAKHVGDDEDLDIHIYRGDQLIGMGEVKTDTDPQLAAGSNALFRDENYILGLPSNFGDWGVSFKRSANIKKLREGVVDVIALANKHGLRFVDPEHLWHESHQELLTYLKKLGITYLWHQEVSTSDQAMFIQEPYGGQVPDDCPNLQPWITGQISTYQSKQSMQILASANDLELRQFIIFIDSKTPLPIKLYAMHHAMTLPAEKLPLPIWLTDLWVVLPRAFQDCDVAWRYSVQGDWELFVSEGFLDF